MDVHSATLSGKGGQEIDAFSRRGIENQIDFILDRETMLNSSSGAMQAANQQDFIH